MKTVDGQNQSGKFNAMAADTKGRVHLAYANVNSGTAGVRYAYLEGASWKLEIVDGQAQNDMGNVGFGVCVALDKEGDPHVSYMNYTNPAVKYAVRKNGHWQTQVVQALGGVGYPDRNSITIDEQGRPYIGYYDARNGELRLARRQGQKWEIETVDGNGAGFTSSIQVVQDMIWLAYTDGANGGLKVARLPLADFGARRMSRASDSPTP